MPIDHLQLPLETPRLRLREFRVDDAPAVHLYAADPEVSRYMPWGPNSWAETEAFLARNQAQQAAWPRLDLGLAMESRAEGVVVGSIALHLRDASHATAEMGYCLRRDMWGQGIVAEAARPLMRLAFESFGLHRLIATCDVHNTGSFRVMEKLGMRREACFLQDRRVKGQWRDTISTACWRPNGGANAPAAADEAFVKRLYCGRTVTPLRIIGRPGALPRPGHEKKRSSQKRRTVWPSRFRPSICRDVTPEKTSKMLGPPPRLPCRHRRSGMRAIPFCTRG